jgi:outer membrane receptor protein involved in Fe transport
LNLSNLNLGQSQRQGIDYDIQWRQPTDIGRVRVALQGTWNLRARKQVYEGAAYESELGQYANNTQSFTPKHQLKLSAGLERGDWNVLTALNYRSGFSNTMALTTAIYSTEDVWINTRVPGFWTVDLGGNWKPDKAWTLTAHIQNLTNRTPSWILVESAYLLGVDTRFANYYGRTIKLKAAYKF